MYLLDLQSLLNGTLLCSNRYAPLAELSMDQHDGSNDLEYTPIAQAVSTSTQAKQDQQVTFMLDLKAQVGALKLLVLTDTLNKQLISTQAGSSTKVESW